MIGLLKIGAIVMTKLEFIVYMISAVIIMFSLHKIVDYRDCKDMNGDYISGVCYVPIYSSGAAQKARR